MFGYKHHQHQSEATQVFIVIYFYKVIVISSISPNVACDMSLLIQGVRQHLSDDDNVLLSFSPSLGPQQSLKTLKGGMLLGSLELSTDGCTCAHSFTFWRLNKTLVSFRARIKKF